MVFRIILWGRICCTMVAQGRERNEGVSDRLREFITFNELKLDEKAKLLKDSDAKLEGLKLEP